MSLQPPMQTALDALRSNRERLDAVARTGLLDSGTEPVFDRMTALGAKLVRAPVTFLSLVDVYRDYYVSHCGFGEPLASDRELSGRTFCHYALGVEHSLVINDTLADAEYRQVPTVETLGVRAYLGVPLRDDEGNALGSFCAIDFQPREWTESDVDVLTELAESAVREIRLRQALAAARAALQSRERVLAQVVHDLRNPLWAVTAYTQLLADVVEDPGAREDLDAIRAATKQMSALVSDLFHTDETKRERETHHVGALVRDALHMMEPIARSAFVSLRSGDMSDALVAVDYQSALRVFSNLIKNAIKFSPPGGRVEVSTRSEGGEVHFFVRDEGPGLSPAEVRCAFDAGWQADASDARGRGLGLSIVQEVLAREGGRVWIAPEDRQGATFAFSLPAKPPG